jgi:Flp pilus assembly protein TadB
MRLIASKQWKRIMPTCGSLKRLSSFSRHATSSGGHTWPTGRHRRLEWLWYESGGLLLFLLLSSTFWVLLLLLLLVVVVVLVLLVVLLLAPRPLLLLLLPLLLSLQSHSIEEGSISARWRIGN